MAIQIINLPNHLRITVDNEPTVIAKIGTTIKAIPSSNQGISIFHYGELIFNFNTISQITAPTFTDETDLINQLTVWLQADNTNNVVTTLEEIRDSNDNIEIYAENIDLNTDALESIIGTGNTLLSSISGKLSNITDNTEDLLDNNNGTFDAFYRKRFSTPETIFDSKQIADKQTLFWDDQLVSGSGGASTYNANQASTTLSVANLTAGKRIRQTFRHFNYQPGKSQLFVLTGIFGTSQTGITKRSGMFNDNNGIFFQQSSSGFAIGLRTFTSGSAVNTIVPQANWNIDKFDGSGTSGITLDFTKTLIWFADFEWLGVGTIRYGFFVNGRPYYVHALHNSNINTLVYMSTPNLPLRYEIENDGSGAVSSFTHICSTVITEGGRSDTGYPFALNRKANVLTTLNNAATYPLIAIRLNSGYLGAFIKLLQVKVSCNSTAQYSVELIVNPTIVGTALVFNPLANSGIDFAYGTNATTVTDGTVIFSDIAQESNNYLGGSSFVLDSDFALGSNIAGTSDIVVLAVSRITGTTETFTGALNFKTTL